jgi:hypothetical protein
LRAIAGCTLTLVNPRPCVFGPLRPAVAVEDILPVLPAPRPLGVNAAAAVNDFVNAWDEHHQIGIREGCIQELGAVARVEFPVVGVVGAVNEPMAKVPAVRPQLAMQAAQAPHAAQAGNPQFLGANHPPVAGFAGQFSPYIQNPLQAQQYFGQQNSMFVPQQGQWLGYPQGNYYNQYVQQPQYALAQQFVLGQQFVPQQQFVQSQPVPPQQQVLPSQQQL